MKRSTILLVAALAAPCARADAALAASAGERPAAAVEPVRAEPAPGAWPGLDDAGALAAWCEGVRTNAALPTAARFRDGSLLPLLRREALEPLLAGPDRQAPWIKEARAYVETELWHAWFDSLVDRPNPDWGRAYDFTVKNGSKDPFLEWMSIVGQHMWHWDERARPQLAALEEAAAAGTPFQRLLAAHARQTLDPSDAHAAALRAAAVAWAESCAPRPEDSRAVRKVLLSFFEDGDAALAEALEASASDPWIGLLFRGKAEIDAAWAARGSGWASTVTEEGWRGFREHQRKAAEALERAHALHPEFPNAAAYMVKVSGAGCDGEMDLWFGRALAAQIDSRFAWHQYMWHNLPRWGGSVARLRRLAQAALDTGRPEAAFWYGPVMAHVRSESDADPEAFWTDPAVADALETSLAPSLGADGADRWTRRVASGLLAPVRFFRGDLEGAVAANGPRRGRTAAFTHVAFGETAWFSSATLLDGLGGANAARIAPLFRKWRAGDWAACAEEADAVWNACRGLEHEEATLLSTIAAEAWARVGYAEGEPRRFGFLRKKQFCDWINYDFGFLLEEGTDEGAGHSRNGEPHWLKLQTDVPALLEVAGSFEPWGEPGEPHVLLVRLGANGNSWGQNPESPSVVLVREAERLGAAVLPDVGKDMDELDALAPSRLVWRRLPEGWPARYRIVFAGSGVRVWLGDETEPVAEGGGWTDAEGDPFEGSLPDRASLWFGHRNVRFFGVTLRKPSDGESARVAALGARSDRALAEDDPESLNARAWALYLDGRAEEALPLAVRAAELADWKSAPLDVAALDTLACVQSALGRAEEAKTALAKAFGALLSHRDRLARGDADAVLRILKFHLAQIYDRAGETDLAKATLELVVRARFEPGEDEAAAFRALAEKFGLAPAPARRRGGGGAR